MIPPFLRHIFLTKISRTGIVRALIFGDNTNQFTDNNFYTKQVIVHKKI
jgi:hypothetical protein